MNRRAIITFFAGLAALTLISFLQINDAPQVFAGSEHNLSGWAWSDMPDGSDQIKNPSGGKVGRGLGWISFNSKDCDSDGDGLAGPNAPAGCPAQGTPIPNYGVTVASNGRLSGYAWSEYIGWITFNQNDLGGCPLGQCRADFNKNTGQVTGWARALANGGGWDGWISLSGTATNGSPYGVTVSGSEWRGFAWGSDVLGWISFDIAGQLFGGPPPPCIGVCGTDGGQIYFSITGFTAHDPSSGYAPLLNVDLTATISVSGSGPFNYTFYCNRNDANTNITPGWAAKFDGVSKTTKAAPDVCNYNSAGTYTPKVIVEFDGHQPLEKRTSVSVTTPPEDFSLSSSNNIEAFITSAPLATSTETVVAVVPLFGYNSAATLSVCNSSDPECDVSGLVLPPSGTIYHFRNNTNGQESSGSSPTMTLNSGQFSSGADFWVRIPRESALVEYTIRLKGKGGGKIRFVDVKLNAKVISPNFREI